MPVLEKENFEIASQPLRPGSKSAQISPFLIGDWCVLPELNRLRRRDGSEERQIEPRLVKLLCILAANEDRVLSREELVEQIWPRVIVNENSLTRAVSELRKQLQARNSRVPNYIETIPKRGYRLIPRVEPVSTTTGPVADRAWDLASLLPSSQRYRLALAAACVCLLFASWVSIGMIGDIQQQEAPVLLSDEVIDSDRSFHGGNLQLSTMEIDSSLVEAIATPVMSLDKKQYAFIQYDTRGSTIFLGGLGTAIEPKPVYYSDRYLFNLAWSPIGNNLLFAMQPPVATAAMYSSVNETAELVMLNLNTLETSRLVEDMSPAEPTTATGLNLT